MTCEGIKITLVTMLTLVASISSSSSYICVWEFPEILCLRYLKKISGRYLGTHLRLVCITGILLCKRLYHNQVQKLPGHILLRSLIWEFQCWSVCDYLRCIPKLSIHYNSQFVFILFRWELTSPVRSILIPWRDTMFFSCFKYHCNLAHQCTRKVKIHVYR